MTIKELEEQTRLSRANIRFYEKEGLISPERQANNYRDYQPRDVRILNRIIVLRKLGLSVSDIKKIFGGTLDLAAAIQSQEEQLNRQMDALRGAIDLCAQMIEEKVNLQHFDERRYLEQITSEEKRGLRFKNIADDYLKEEMRLFGRMWKHVFFYNFEGTRKRYGLKWSLVTVLAICLVRGLAKQFVFHTGTFVEGFFYPFILFAVVSAVMLPVYLLRIKHKRSSAGFRKLIVFISAAFLLFVLTVVVVLLLNTQFHFWF
ncbi:MAG: MerR family transcriptional regulator [Sporolactobacillus sp.]